MSVGYVIDGTFIPIYTEDLSDFSEASSWCLRVGDLKPPRKGLLMSVRTHNGTHEGGRLIALAKVLSVRPLRVEYVEESMLSLHPEGTDKIFRGLEKRLGIGSSRSFWRNDGVLAARWAANNSWTRNWSICTNPTWMVRAVHDLVPPKRMISVYLAMLSSACRKDAAEAVLRNLSELSDAAAAWVSAGDPVPASAFAAKYYIAATDNAQSWLYLMWLLAKLMRTDAYDHDEHEFLHDLEMATMIARNMADVVRGELTIIEVLWYGMIYTPPRY